MNTYIYSSNKKIFVALIAVLLLIALPISTISAYAAPEDNIVLEYRYTDGETVTIPPTVTQFGISYRLINTAPPVLESSLPNVRTYTFRITGALLPEELAQVENLPGFTATPVDVDNEREVEHVEVMTMPTNDIDEVPGTMTFTTPDGYVVENAGRSGVTFTGISYDAYGLPNGYTAEVIYRGIEKFTQLGYYTGQTEYYTSVNDGSTDTYVILATYEPTTPPIIGEPEVTVETVEGPVEVTEEAPETITTTETIPAPEPEPEPAPAPESTEFTPEEQMLLDSQVPLSPTSPIQNIIDGNTPLGSGGVTSAWSVLSLLFSVVSIIIAIITIVSAATNRNAQGLQSAAASNYANKRLNLMRIFVIALSALTLILWLILDDLARPQVWINKWTIFVGILFVINVVAFVIYTMNNKKSKMDTEIGTSNGATA